jgi:TolA-binding protein
VIREKDKLSQNAYYHLADCYLETGQKQFAQNAFYSAYQMDFDEQVKEDALFNYAKLTYELAYDPFNQSMTALKQYIADYPGSDRLDEAYAYLINLFYSTKDYQASIDAIENIRVKNKDLRKAYQKITFMRGVQLFNANRYEEAMDNFRKSLGNNYNAKLTAEAKFWMGETHYRLGEYHKAIDYYDNFMATPGAYDLEMYPMTKYNLGYAYFMLKYYDNAVIEFQQFVNRPIDDSREFKTDAMLRMGDCYFITKNYKEAIEYYEKAIFRKSPDSDYATYQKALSEGALGNNSEKIAELRKIVNSYTSSSYTDDAYFEIASTYLVMNDSRNALNWFEQLTSKFPNSSYYLKSLQKIGLIYYNENDYDQALASLKKVVKDYAGTDESKESLLTIRNIYMDKNQVDDYYAYAENIPFANVTANEQDSITYLAAENLYMNNQCGPATESFNHYIGKFPNGAFILNANYYKAECELKLGNTGSALKGYNFVISFPKSRFTENALKRAAEINFNNEDYAAALDNFNNLELNADYRENLTIAYEGQMECNYQLGQYRLAMDASRKLLTREKLTNEQVLTAHYILAKSALAIDSMSVARREFEKTIELSDGDKGAEAKYMLASIQYTLKNYVKAEEMIFELANEFPASEYWKAKGFIMLADIYSLNGNLFQAKQTLQSIIDNYPGQDLKDVAGQKLNTILRQEQLEEKQVGDSIPGDKE